ncbi:hypothetical protein C8F04DRAFT_1093323, partial [Mycena alexandri]
ILFASIAFPFLASFCLSLAAVHGAPVVRRTNTQLCTGTDGSGFCSGFLAGQCFNLGGGGQFSLIGDLTGCKGFPCVPSLLFGNSPPADGRTIVMHSVPSVPGGDRLTLTRQMPAISSGTTNSASSAADLPNDSE